MRNSFRRLVIFSCAALLAAHVAIPEASAKPNRGKRGKQAKRARQAKRAKQPKQIVKISMSTVLREHPGEAAHAVAALDAGTEVRVLERKGRWIRVKVGDHTGWLTRTQVEPVGQRRAKRRKGPTGWKRRAAELPTDRTAETAVERPEAPADGARRVVVIARRADVYARPSARALIAFNARAGDRLVVSGTAKRGRWLLVDGGGRTGWIAAAAVRDADADAESQDDHIADAAVSDAGAAPRRPPAPLPRLVLRGAADLGVRSVGMDFSSDLQAGLGNYLVSTQAASVGARVELGYRLAGPVIAGADAGYRLSYSNPGIHYESSAGPAGDIAFSTHELDAGAALGARFGGDRAPVDVFARGGYHYEAFLVDELGNVGRLPNESLAGPTAGLGVSLPRFDDTLALAAGVDVLIAGERSQTEGLEDGDAVEVDALWARISLAYRLGDALDLTARYRYARAHTRWSGPSARVPEVDGAERDDSIHTFALALGVTL